MDRTEKLQYQQSIEKYFEDNKVYYLFDKLLKELIILKPKDPIDYLIKRIKLPDTKRIFITGSPGVNRREIALSIGNHFKYEVISTGDILRKEITKKLEVGNKLEPYIKLNKLAPDETTINLVKQELIRLEKNSTSYIVEGFPRNRIQAMFLQSVGILPDNVIVLTNSDNKINSRIKDKILDTENLDKNKVKEIELDMNNSISNKDNLQLINKINKINNIVSEALEEYQINVKAVKEVYQNHINIMVKERDIENIIEDISRIMKFKNKTLGARKPPRILLLGPPCSKKSLIADAIAKKYSIIHISISSLLNNEYVKKNTNENSKSVIKSMDKGELVDHKFVYKVLEDRLFASDAMINGWILTGFPKDSYQMKYIENEHNKAFKPSLIIAIELEDDTVLKRSSLRRIDPYTGSCIYLNDKNFDSKSNIAKRLIRKKEDEEDIIKKRLENWKSFAYSEFAQLKDVIRIDGEKESDVNNLVERVSDAIENSS